MKFSRGTFGLFLSNVLEYYDTGLYGYMIARLTPLFFPHDNAFISEMSAFSGFAVGFMMRPIGGAIFGHIADRYGRKKSLTYSILLTALPTTVIGLLPTYQSIDIIAPIALLTCRLMQGLCVGGESAGILVYVMEQNGYKNGNFVGSLLCSTSFLGAILGALSSAFFNQSWMPEWTWRVPFLIGVVVVFYGYYLRKRIHETNAFQNIKETQKEKNSIPVFNALKNYQRSLVCTFFLGAACSIPYHMLTIYINTALTGHLGLTISQATIRTVCVLSALALCLPFIGKWVDRVGNRKCMIAAMGTLMIVTYPAFLVMTTHADIITVTCCQTSLILIYSGFLASISTFLMDLFPVHVRSSGIGIAYNFGNAVFGGTTPMISKYLVNHTGSSSSPAFYMIFGGVIGVLATYFARLESEKKSMASYQL